MTRFTNLIAGTGAASKAGLFELHARGPGPGRALGQWPRSGGHEVAAALDGLDSPGLHLAVGLDQLEAGWRALVEMAGSTRPGAPPKSAGSNERREPLETGLDQLHARLGVSRQDANRLLFRGSFTSFGFGARHLGEKGPVALFCHWSIPLNELYAEVADCLFQGRSVVLLPDPALPMAGAAIAQALIVAGLDGARIAVVHGLDSEGWLALAEAVDDGRSLHPTGRISVDQKLELAPYAERSPVLQRLVDGLGTPRESEWGAPAFLREAHTDLAQVRRAARDLVRAAFGPGHGFGGVAHGAPLVARIPRPSFSAFTAALVAELDALQATANPPLAFLNSTGKPSVRARYDELWKAGLDLGATLVTGGGVSVAGPGGVHLHPGLLVNLAGDSGLFDLGEPLGVLRLQRA